jgi:hypothetical protein
MKEKRKNIRYATSTRIRINENQNIILFLKDICVSGCAITNSTGDSDTDVPEISDGYPEINQEYRMLIIPEIESRVMPFELAVELCWAHTQGKIYEAGGLISGYPEGGQYQSFANYLAWRTARI